MITNFEHALRVQTTRARSGKRGYAKAVRRWMRRTDSAAARDQLPVNWSAADAEPATKPNHPTEEQHP